MNMILFLLYVYVKLMYIMLCFLYIIVKLMYMRLFYFIYVLIDVYDDVEGLRGGCKDSEMVFMGFVWSVVGMNIK